MPTAASHTSFLAGRVAATAWTPPRACALTMAVFALFVLFVAAPRHQAGWTRAACLERRIERVANKMIDIVHQSDAFYKVSKPQTAHTACACAQQQ